MKTKKMIKVLQKEVLNLGVSCALAGVGTTIIGFMMISEAARRAALERRMNTLEDLIEFSEPVEDTEQKTD